MSLGELRKSISALDEKIVKLLNDRAELSLKIGKEKHKNGQPIYAPQREKEVLAAIKRLNKGPMTSRDFEAIYREIMSSSLALEKSLKVAYLGAPGTNTHQAATRKFGSQIQYCGYPSIADIFRAVENGHCDYGVVPVENSVEGAVTPTYDLLAESDLKICAQIMMKISHHLLSNVPLDKIKNVYSNAQVFGQCRNWLLANLPQAGLIPVASTTDAAQKVVKSKDSAALASQLAAQVYGVKVLKQNVQDIAHNTTRFFVIGQQDVPPTGKDRTSIVFSIKDRVGALHAMLAPFRNNKINLTKIESRPSKKKAWEYYFFVDLEGHKDDKNVRRALGQLEDMCTVIKVLGAYPDC